MTDPAARPPRSPLLVQVGARVRAARTAGGLTRQALSERSHVSPRYLAQLEAGDGNMSLALLDRVAQAIGIPLVQLIGGEDPVSTRFHRADATTQEAVMRLLSAEANGRAARICLVGLRGAGKSTLGRLAAEALGLPFVELNREIEADAGMPVAEIIGLYGQEGYRAFEARALAGIIANRDRVMLAAAGGIVADAATYARLLARFHTIWISATPQEHMSRVRAQGDTRPMEGNPEAMAQLRSLLAARVPLYERADARLDTSGSTVEASAAALVALIEARRYLGPAGNDP